LTHALKLSSTEVRRIIITCRKTDESSEKASKPPEIQQKLLSLFIQSLAPKSPATQFSPESPPFLTTFENAIGRERRGVVQRHSLKTKGHPITLQTHTRLYSDHDFLKSPWAVQCHVGALFLFSSACGSRWNLWKQAVPDFWTLASGVRARKWGGQLVYTPFYNDFFGLRGGVEPHQHR